MRSFCAILFIFIRINAQNQFKQIEQLVVQWSPLIWMAPEEKYMPSSVDEFLTNVHVADEHKKPVEFSISNRILSRNDSSSLHLVTNENLEKLKTDKSSFLHGRNPKENPVPVYAIITQCTPFYSFFTSSRKKIQKDINAIYKKTSTNLFFHVTYWLFFPYNEGKEVCVIGKVPAFSVFGRCLGKRKAMLNHVGDWEHLSLSFEGNYFPKDLFLAVHDAGGYYRYDHNKRLFRYHSQVTRKGIVQRPKFPPIARMQGGHPVLFSAYGSHGLWTSPGEHYFVRVPKLTDKNGYGVPWKTWNSVEMFHLGYSKLPDWMVFKGRWGNPKSNCFISKKLGICEYNDGPLGILRDVNDFYCWKND